MAKLISDASVAELQRHPDFEAAVAASMRGSIELHQGGKLSNWILNDRARAWFGHALLYLHAAARPDDPLSGLTPARIRDLAVGAGICSAGRAAAMLSLMRVAGYLERAPVAGDKRVRRLAPTAKLLDVQRQRLRRQFEAIAIVLPEAQAVLASLGRPEFENALALAIGEEFMSGTRLLSRSPDLKPFAEYSAGMVVLFSLMLATEQQGSFAIGNSIAVSISELARRFRVSRTQVLRLLREAEEDGFLARAATNYESVVLRSKLKRDMLNMFAMIFLLLAGAAAEATAATRAAA
jgi:DNA-binding MarR family transcriptional regulator